MLPTDSKERKDTPIFSGVLMYFPDAIAEVAKVSKIGNDKHNPGEPLHWSRSKSDDHLDAASRHLIDAGPDGSGTDENGVLHLAYNAWRSLAKLQLVLEARDAQGEPKPFPATYCTRLEDHSGACNGLPRRRHDGMGFCYSRNVSSTGHEIEPAPLAVSNDACRKILPGRYNGFRACKLAHGHPENCELPR